MNIFGKSLEVTDLSERRSCMVGLIVRIEGNNFGTDRKERKSSIKHVQYMFVPNSGDTY